MTSKKNKYINRQREEKVALKRKKRESINI